MSASVWKPVRADLRRILLTTPGIPDTEWEAKRFRPAPGIAWIREKLNIAGASTDTLGARGQTIERAIYAVDVMWPATGALSDAEDLADAIRQTFWHGRGIGSSGPNPINGSVIASSRQTTVEGDVWTEVPVRIEFFVRRYTRQAA